MRRTVLVISSSFLAVPAAAEDGVSETAVHQVNRWELSAAAGVSSVTTVSVPMPGMQLMADATAQSTMPTTASETSLEASGLVAIRYRIADRIVWSIPTLSFAYLGGTAGEREWIPWAGLTSWGAGYSSIAGMVAQGELGAGIGAREWLSADTAVNLTAGIASGFLYVSNPGCQAMMMCDGWRGPTTWHGTITAGVSQRVSDAITLNAGFGGSQRLLFEGGLPDNSTERHVTLAFGSVQAVGLRALPLVQAQLNPRWSLDGYATGSYEFRRDRLEQRYLVGFTRIWQ